MISKKDETEIPPHLLSSLEDLATDVSFLAELVQLIAISAGSPSESHKDPENR